MIKYIWAFLLVFILDIFAAHAINESIRTDGHWTADILTHLKGIRSIERDGAKCDGITNDTSSIQTTINYCITNKCEVLVPPSTTGCLVRSPLIMYPSLGLGFHGISDRASKIICEHAGDCIILGDFPGTLQARDFRLHDLFISQTSSGATWGVNCAGASNAVIERMTFVNASTLPTLTTTGGIKLNFCINIRIINNTFAGVDAGQVSIYTTNSSNTIVISGNRIDGTGNVTGGVGLYIFGASYTIIGNTMESLKTGIKLGAAFGVHIAGNYFENIGVCILSDISYIQGIGIVDNFVSALGSTNAAFDLNYMQQAHITGNTFYGRPLNQYNGAYIAINADHTSNKDWIVGPNALGLIGGSNPAVDKEIALNVRYALHNIDLVSEHQTFVAKDILQDSFKAWTVTPGAPDAWTSFGAGSVRIADSPIGQYSAQIQAGVANANGIYKDVYPTISATRNSDLRGRRVMFCFWLKESTGGGQVDVQLVNGVSISEVSYTSTSVWVKQCQGAVVDTAATHLQVIISGLSTDKAHLIAGPSLYVGTTIQQGSVETP